MAKIRMKLHSDGSVTARALTVVNGNRREIVGYGVPADDTKLDNKDTWRQAVFSILATRDNLQNAASEPVREK